MVDMSFEEAVLIRLMRAVQAVGLDAIVVGNAAAALHGVPITTQDIDLFVRDTRRNQTKIDELVVALGDVRASRPFEPSSRMIRIEGLPVDVDIVFELSSRARFESIRSRCRVLELDRVPVRVASLADVIAAKRAAGRPKDLATLPMLEQFAAVAAKVQREPSQRARRKS
jgi:hypothetical protein